MIGEEGAGVSRIIEESFSFYFGLPLVEQAIKLALEQIDLARTSAAWTARR